MRLAARGPLKSIQYVGVADAGGSITWGAMLPVTINDQAASSSSAGPKNS